MVNSIATSYGSSEYKYERDQWISIESFKATK